MSKKALLWAWIVFIIIVSFVKLPESAEPSRFPEADKLVHFFLYFVLAILSKDTTHRKLLLWLYPIILGGGIEILQGLLTDYRSADIWDFLADLLGFGLGLYYKKFIDIFK